MDAFHNYNNLLVLFLGNENIAKNEDSMGAPFIKAAARDMKAYRNRKGYRNIPIGYSAADIKELRPMLQDYLTCGGNASETIEFFGINSYSWCDPSDYWQSTYNQLQDFAKDFPVPIFFTETGCNVPGPRLWADQEAIFGPEMIGDWSGAIVYEWIQEQNNYGIINYGPPVGDPTKNDESVFDNWTRKGTPTPVSPDFENLKARWATLSPAGVNRGDYDPSHVSTRACPAATESGWWAVDGDVKLPALDETITAFADPTNFIRGSMTLTEPSSSSTSTSTAETESASSDADISDEDQQNAETADQGEGKGAAIGVSIGGMVLGLMLWF
jgi:1,3-beta-glucanosyltransferase GAS1